MRITPEHKFTSSRGFIVIDGVNGAGKTTLQKRLKSFIDSDGNNFTLLYTKRI